MEFANRIQKLEPAAVYDILKYTLDGRVIAFAAGNPSPDAFPAQQMAELSKEILSTDSIRALQYGPTQGYQPLRDALLPYLKEHHGIYSENDEILITSGATQGIELVPKIFCNEGDTIICENPTFIGSLNSFRSYNLNIVGVEIESDGMNVDMLEQKLKENPHTRFIYTIPNFHNPAGVTMSMEKRRRVYELAVKYNALILEDDPYGELRYFGEHIPAVKTLDKDGIVLYAGSFSKVISPGLRVGFMLLDRKYFNKMAVAKQASDVHTPMLSQMIVYEFMKKHGLRAHIEEINGIYRKKLQLTLDMLEKHMAGKIEYVKPEGGLYVYCKLPESVNMKDYWKACIDGGVATVYGNAFLINEDEPTQYFRINFSTPTDEQLVKGITILGEVYDKMTQ